jgi:mitochondrial import inner membrane translocase subunit TIM50
MLSRALGRSLQKPALWSHPPSSRIASTQWTRGLANRPHRAPPKKPTDYTKPPDATSHSRPTSIGPQRTSGAGAAFGAQKATSASTSGEDDAKEQYSKQQYEINKEASPERNTVSRSEGGGSGPVKAEGKQGEDPAYSGLQDEVHNATSPSKNTTPQSQSDVDAAEPQAPIRPLPDLTQGIPSTLEYETMGSTSGGKQEGPAFNLTEDPALGGSGRGKGELPASAYISSSEKKRLRIANYMYAGTAVLCVLGYVYLGRNWESEEEEHKHPDAPSGWGLGLMWNRAKARTGDQLNYYNEPAFKKLLPDPDPSLGMDRPYTLVMSLEDLLVHSEWSREHGWRMAKRPGVDYFIRYLSQYYELVIFTSVPWAIAEPIIKKLDPYHIVQWPLFREATLYEKGEYIKVWRFYYHMKRVWLI